MCPWILCQVDPKPGCLSELLGEPAKNKAAQASPAEILAKDRGWGLSICSSNSDADDLLQVQGNAVSHHVFLSQIHTVVMGRWYLPNFIDEVKGLAQGHTSNAWGCEQRKDTTAFLLGENTSRASGTGKFGGAVPGLAYQPDYF